MGNILKKKFFFLLFHKSFVPLFLHFKLKNYEF